jgi:hypothetical protein
MDTLPTAAPEGRWQDVIRLDEGQLRVHVDQVVRYTVDQTFNSLLEAEALYPQIIKPPALEVKAKEGKPIWVPTFDPRSMIVPRLP